MAKPALAPDPWSWTDEKGGGVVRNPVRRVLHNVKFVNVYLTDRAYGGPEEGGWYFDTGTQVECHPTPSPLAARIKAKLERDPRFSNEGRPPISSVASEGRYAVLVENHPGKDWPDQTPRYE